MRVLNIVSNLSRGGTQRVAVNVALCYKNAGIESAVLTQRGSGPRADDLLNAGVEIFTAERESSDPNTHWNTQARDWKPDVIHIHRGGIQNDSEDNLLKFLKANRGQQVRVIEHSHFGRCDRSKDRDLIDAHIQISQWCLWRWRKWARGLKPQPVGVFIPHMVDADRFTPADDEQVQAFRAKHNIPKDSFVFGFLAQPLGAKWSPILFDSFRAVAEHDNSVYLMIAGIPDSSKFLYQSFPDSIKSRIIVLPFITGDETLRTVYSAMDTFVHTPKFGETFGLICTESMCCHTPVATLENPARDNAQAEIVGHKNGGVVAAQPKALIEAMRMLKDDQDLHQRCSIQGRKSVIDRFNEERVGQMLISLLNHVHDSTDRNDLENRIDADDLFITSITDEQILNAGGGRVGTYSLSQRITQKAVLRPAFQRALKKYKAIKSR